MGPSSTNWTFKKQNQEKCMAKIIGETNEPVGVFRRVSWAAIFAGVVAAVVLQLLLTLLGTGIGAAKIEPLQQADPGKGLGIGAAIWLFVSTLISVYVGARVAGHLAGRDRTLHGLLTWGTTAILGMMFLTSAAGALFGGAASFLGGATAGMSRDQRSYANSRYEQQSSSRPALAPTGRDAQELNTQPQDETSARRAGDVAARRVSQAALWSFFVLLISGVVAAYAGRGARRGESPSDFAQGHPA
jgi:hypothetical protein